MSIKLDELQWSDPAAADEMQGIHSNSVLFYFMRSPYFDQTSNNNTVYNQALHNHNMFPVLETRERFEEFLRSMSGVEYIVHQAPAEMAPGTGTGVWVIRKQLRRKRNDGLPDDLTVYADYFVVGYNIYQAPTLADVLSSRITSMAAALGKAFSAMHSMQSWSPAKGHVCGTTDDVDADADDDDEAAAVDADDDDDDDMEDDDDAVDAVRLSPSLAAPTTGTAAAAAEPATDGDGDALSDGDVGLDPRLAEESYAIHMLYGGEYMDEQPVSGRPGDFHIALAGGGRSAVGQAGGGGDGSAAKGAGAGLGKDKTGKDKDRDGKGGAGKGGKDGKDGKAAKAALAAKPKRRKSKGPAAA